MDIQAFCRKIYQDFVDRQHDLDPELIRALKSHERVPLFIDNISREFSELTFEVRRETIIQAVEDMTRFFIYCVQKSSRDRIMSDMDKLLIQAKEKAQQDFIRDAEALHRGGVDELVRTQRGEVSKQTVDFDPGEGA